MRKDCPHPGKNPNWQPPADFKVSDYVDDSDERPEKSSRNAGKQGGHKRNFRK